MAHRHGAAPTQGDRPSGSRSGRRRLTQAVDREGGQDVVVAGIGRRREPLEARVVGEGEQSPSPSASCRRWSSDLVEIAPPRCDAPRPTLPSSRRRSHPTGRRRSSGASAWPTCSASVPIGTRPITGLLGTSHSRSEYVAHGRAAVVAVGQRSSVTRQRRCEAAITASADRRAPRRHQAWARCGSGGVASRIDRQAQARRHARASGQ
jgi:hypothetical protein